MASAEFINGLISHPERMNSTTLYQLRTIVARYPYFQEARLLLLCNLYLLHDPDFNTELHRSIFYMADRRELWRFVNGLTPAAIERVPATLAASAAAPAEKTDDAVPQSSETPDRTMSLIDDFLKSMPGVASAHAMSADSISTTDYLEALGLSSASESETSSSTPVDLAPKDLVPEASEPGEKSPESTSSDTSESVLQPEFLTETLARIYIKQKKYDRALAIIRSLYLNFPEKSIYFADQIRFLEKLVRNNQQKKV